MANRKKSQIASRAILLVLCFILAISFAACGSKVVKEVGNEKMEVIKTRDDIPRPNGSDVIYVINPSKTRSLTGKSRLSNEETAMLVSLQGIVAQTKAEIYIGKPEDTLLQYIVQNYGKTVEELNDMSEILDRFIDHFPDKGYVKLKYSTTAVTTSFVNQAATLAAANKWLMAFCTKNDDDPLEKALQEKGFQLKKDYFFLTGGETEEDVIKANKDKLNTKVLAAISPTHYASRDYGIAVKAPFFFYRAKTTSNETLKQVYGSLNPLAAVIGWEDVAIIRAGDASAEQYGARMDQWANAVADYGLYAVPVSEIYNLSLYTSIKEESNLQQKQTQSRAGENVHYATIIYNNGLDMGAFLKFLEDKNMFASEDKSEYPVGWTINPSLYDYIPMAMRYAYENMTEHEYFVASTAGLGWLNLSLLEEHGNPYGSTLSAYMERTNDILGRAGLPYISYVGRLDDKTKVDKKSIIELFGNLSNVKGGFVLSDNGVSPTGGIKWVDDKPFVGDRETIRDYSYFSIEQQQAAQQFRNKRLVLPKINDTAKKTAERLAQYDVNPSHIEGYSVVQVYSDYNYKNLITNFYKNLDTNKVRIVTPDEFIRLIQQNITEKNDVSSVKVLSIVKEEEATE